MTHTKPSFAALLTDQPIAFAPPGGSGSGGVGGGYFAPPGGSGSGGVGGGYFAPPGGSGSGGVGGG
jgi:hypothetical protein